MARVLAKRALVPHPQVGAPAIQLGAKLSWIAGAVLKFEYVVSPIAGLELPPLQLPERRDELWRHSCLEAFVALGDAGYVEYNFAPSRQWGSYRFDGYREGMRPALDLPPPDIFVERDADRLALTAFVELPADGPAPSRIGMSAVIEESDGRISYWALAHPPGRPDFHHRDCFALELPAASGA